MANNKNTKSIDSQILLNKVGELSNRLKRINQTSAIGQTQEELIIEANKLLSDFFTQMSSPIFNPTDVLPDTKPVAADYNQNLNAVLSDLNILFAELNNISNIILSNFNFMISDTNRLLGRLKSSYSKLGDYILFSNDPNKDSMFFSDSFNNLDRIEFNSKLISTVQAEIDQSQGIVTLPIDTAAMVPIVITNQPTINNNSNGIAGNNREKNAALNNDINSILDNNADTWFEYENVIVNTQDTFESLVLDITLNLDQSKIINYIRINPNNFGTNNPLTIDTIETSIDGKHFINIKDDIPMAGFQSDNEEDLFALDPSTSKFAGQGIYSFTPRFAKYIHIVFKQNTPYSIADTTGTVRSRYAIGIRDIEVAAIPFKDTGEIISTSYTTDEEIKKVSVISHQFPESDLSLISIEHYVSGDEGLTWTRINPTDIETLDTSLPSIVNFNTLDNNSVNTTPSVKSMKYKAVLKRNNDSFNDPSSFKNSVVQNVSELHQIPSASPFELTLKDVPVNGSIKVLDPSYGSRGLDTFRYQIGSGNGTALTLHLPFAPIQKDKTKNLQLAYSTLDESDPQAIRVNGNFWYRSSLASASSTSEVYELDYSTGEIKFGDGINGKAVPAGSIIDIMFYPERIHISSDEQHLATLDYSTSNDKKSFVIEAHGTLSTSIETLNKGTKVHKLKHKNISGAQTFSDTTVFATYVTYVDGQSELTVDGQYSIDFTNGIIYTRTPTNSIAYSTVTYHYTPMTQLSEDDWDFVKDSGYQQISINKNALLSNSVTSEAVEPSTRYFGLQKLSILQGTLTFSGPDADTIFAKEVPFINGQSELVVGTPTVEDIGALGPGVVNYTFRTPISQVTDLKVQLSNTTVFASEVFTVGDVTAPGQFFIDRPGNKIVVFNATSVADAGTVRYYYNDLMKSSSGLYSVNYKTGEVYTALTVGAGITANYDYTHYIVKYKISRNITDFVFDSSENKLTISEKEILDRLNVAKQDSTQTDFYQVSYDKIKDNREELQALAPYFSPILRDYALKIILESNLVF